MPDFSLSPLSILGGVQALGGIAQSFIGAGQARRAISGLKKLQSPTTVSSASISDYYNRASQNPYESAMYRMQQQNIARGATQGISALQDRRSGLAGIGGIVRGQNDALLRAGANAEQQQLRMLGDATRLKASDDNRVFQINKMLPYETRRSLLASQAAAGNQILNSGLTNIFGGLQSGMMGLQGNNKNTNPLYNY